MVDASVHVPPLLRTLLRAPGGFFKLAQPFKSSAGARFNDRFTLRVALGTGTVEWTLLLDATRPDAPPDLVFDEGTQGLLQDVRYAELQGIIEWNVARPTALLRLLEELRARLIEAARLDVLAFAEDTLKFEVESVVALCPSAQVRFVDRASMLVECVLPISLEAAGGAATDQGEEVCRLALRLDRNLKDVRASLAYPPDVEDCMQAACPMWTAGATHAFDFVPLVQDQVQRKATARHMRSRFIAALSQHLTPLTSSPGGASASFLIDLDHTFDAVVHLSLPLTFPQDKPAIVLQSVVQLVDRRPITDVVLDYPFNPDWPPETMATQMLAVLSAQLPEFRGKTIQGVQAALHAMQSKAPGPAR